MKKLLIVLLMMWLLIGVEGCGSAPIFPLLWSAIGTATALSINTESSKEHEGQEGGAWYIKSSDPNQIDIPNVVGAE